MGRFYLDMEFTNGNYYLVDIPEIAPFPEECGKIFQLYKDKLFGAKTGVVADGDYKQNY